MADNKIKPTSSNTPVHKGKVKRGVERAMTPSGEQPVEELSPFESLVKDSLSTIVKYISDSNKFNPIIKAINGINITENNSDSSNSILTDIDLKMDAILSVLSGQKINTKSAVQSLINTQEDTPLKTISNSIKEVTQMLLDQSTKYGLIDLANSISSEISKIIENINALGISDISESIASLKESIIANPSLDNIKRVCESLNKLNKSINERVDYTSVLSNISAEIKQINDSTDNSYVLSELSNITSILNTIASSKPTNISNSTESLNTVSEKITEISTLPSQDNSMLVSQLVDIKNILLENRELNYAYTDEYKDLLKTAKASIEDISKQLANLDMTHITNLSEQISNVINSSNVSENISNQLNTLNETISNLSNITTVNNQDSIGDNIGVAVSSALSEDVEQIIDAINDSNDSISKTIESYLDNDKSKLNNNLWKIQTAISCLSEALKTDPTIAREVIDVNIHGDGIETEALNSLLNISSSVESVENIKRVFDRLNEIELKEFSIDSKSVNKLVNAINILNNIDLEEFYANKNALNYLLNISKNFVKLNELINVKVDKKSAKNVSDVINALSTINNVDFSNISFDLDINGLNNLLDSLSSINYDNSAVINLTNSLSSIIKSLSNIEYDKLSESINTLKSLDIVGLIVDIDNQFKTLSRSEDNESRITAISDLLDGVSSISGFDENKFDKLSSNLRKIIKLTEKPTVFTTLRISDRGLIHILLNNLNEIASEQKSAYDNTKIIGKMLEIICSLSKYDDKEIDKIRRISYSLAKSTTELDSNSLYWAFNNINKIGENIKGWDKNSPVLNIAKYLSQINDLSNKLDYDSVLNIAIKSSIVNYAISVLVSIFNNIDKLKDIVQNSSDTISAINTGLSAINTIDLTSISSLNDAIISLIKTSFSIHILKQLNVKDIDITEQVTALNSIVEQLNKIDKFNNVENFEDLRLGINALTITNLALGLMSVTAPLAIIGAKLISYEVSAISTVIDKFNGISYLDKNAFNSLKSFSEVLIISSGLLLFGAFIGKYVAKNIIYLALFTAELSLFMLTTIGAYNLATKGLGKAEINAENFAKLLVVSGAIMLFGSFIYQLDPQLSSNATKFTFDLTVFMLGTVSAYILASKYLTKDIIDIAERFTLLTAISAATLLLGGGLFAQFPAMMGTTLLFGVYLTVFVAGTVSVFAMASKTIKEAKSAAVAFSILIGTTTLALLIGAYFMMTPGMAVAALQFAGLSALFLTIFGVAIWALSNIKTESLIKGALAIAGITVIVGMMGYAFQYVAEAAKLMDSVNDFEGHLLTMGTVMLAVGGTVAVLAALSAIPGFAVAMAIGEGLLAGIVAIVWGMGKAISSIAQSMKDLDSVKDFDSKQVKEAITGYIGLTTLFTPLANPLVMSALTAARVSVDAISDMTSEIANSVRKIANLTDKDGKPLTADDYTRAATNIRSVITILGHSILETYKENEDIFSTGSTLKDLLGMDTPFSRVCKSCSNMGEMISEIAEGVKDFADLRVPIYENGKKTGYRSLNTTDFEKAAESIKTVITTLGYALIDIYEENADMFSWTLIGDNPFAMVCKSCGSMGEMISNISAGVKDFADLRMPIYNSEGQITGYRPMGSDDFGEAAKSVEKVLTTLGSAIIATYNSNQYMFTDPSDWHTDADKTPFGMVVKATSGMGQLIYECAKAIKDVSELDLSKLPELEGPNGKIARIITVLAEGIMTSYNSHKEWFEDDSLWHTNPEKTPFGMVMQSFNGITKLIDNIVKTIDKVNKLEFKSSDLATDGELYKKTNRLISVLPKAIIDIMTDKTYGDYLTDDDYIETFEDMEDMFDSFKDIVDSASSAYSKILNIKFDNNTEGTIRKLMKDIVLGVPEAIISEYKIHETYYNKKDVFKNIEKSFDLYEDIIDNVVDCYKSILNSIKRLEATEDTDSVIIKLASNLNLMMTKLSEAINLENINVDSSVVESFVNNISKYKDGIELLSKTYSLVPTDLSVYDNVMNALKLVNTKIAEISGLDKFSEEQEILNKYITTLNNIDLTKVEALNDLMTTMSELASKLGSLDNFTQALSDKIATTLTGLSNEIKNSAAIINKAEELQKKRHFAIKDSIEQINKIMDKKLTVEVIKEENMFSGLFGSGRTSSTSSSTSSAPEASPITEREPGLFNKTSQGTDKADNFFGTNAQQQPQASQTRQVINTPEQTGGIDYNKLKAVIMEAIVATKSPLGQR